MSTVVDIDEDAARIYVDSDEEMRHYADRIMWAYRLGGQAASMICAYKRRTTIYETVADGRQRLAWVIEVTR